MCQPRVVRVERQSTLNQRHHDAEVLAEIGQHKAGIGKYGGIIPCHLQGPLCEVDAFAAVRLQILAETILVWPHVADRAPNECGSVARIALCSLLEKVERLGDLRSRR